VSRAFFALIALCTLAGVASAQTPVLGGRWSGYWISEKNGHNGPLHGKFIPLDDQTYRVNFHGRFAKVIPFWYTTKMHVAGTGDGTVVLNARQNLGPFGTFQTTALATASSFDATFNSRSDVGRFVLTRRR
jgi:hypothetical protein